jgi:epoxyqueuosine reductase
MTSRPGLVPARPAIKETIRDRALAGGFDAVGFAAPELGEEAPRALGEFLARGYHGDMGWLAAKADRRAAPRTLWPDVRSILVVGANYGPAGDPLAALERPGCGAVSVYAQGRDYHDALKKRLRALAGWLSAAYGCEVKLFVDTAPVMEKPLAARAGVGWQGKHTNLVSRTFGSWLFLGSIYTTLALAPDAPETDHCGACRRCLDACPTRAFPAPYRIDARRCISYLTIEHEGHIPAEFRAAMGNRVYGCDDCLAVCPWNKFARRTAHDEFLPRLELTAPKLADLARLDDAAFREVFSGSAVKRLGRDRFVRNILIALGNSGDATSAPVVEALAGDASPLVRAMAAWALRRLLPPGRFEGLKAQALAREPDAAVRAEWLADGDPAAAGSGAGPPALV